MMKYVFVVALLGMLSGTVHSQDGFYLTASEGLGIGGTRRFAEVFDANGYLVGNERGPNCSYQFQAGLGYRLRRWRFQAGLQYMRIGYSIKDVSVAENFNPFENNAVITRSGSYKVGYNMAGIQLQIGYAMPLGKWGTLKPYAGVYSAFTFGGSYKHSAPGYRTYRERLDGAQIAEFGWFTGWGVVGLQAEKRISKKLSAFGGLSTHFQLASTGNVTELGYHNLHLNLGINLDLSKAKAPEKRLKSTSQQQLAN